MRRPWFAFSAPALILATVGALLPLRAHAGEARIVLHLEPWEIEADHPPCEDESARALTCDDVVVEGDRAVLQKLYVYVTGVESLARARFSLNMPMTSVWEACAGQAWWGYPWTDCFDCVVFVFDPPLVPDSPEDLTLLGYFRVFWRGPLTITIGPGTPWEGGPEIDTGIEQIRLGPEDLGVADTAGAGHGYNPCAATTPTVSVTWSQVKAVFE